jgi:anti-anti-sigma regulatory factor
MPRAQQKSGGTTRGRSKVNRAKAETKPASKTEIATAADVVAFEDQGVEAPAALAEHNPECLMLPDCLDSSAASAIKEMLLARRGTAIVVDASEVRRVGAQSLQVLVAAARTWQADQQSYRMTSASAELLETIALIGLPHEDLLLEGPQQ